MQPRNRIAIGLGAAFLAAVLLTPRDEPPMPAPAPSAPPTEPLEPAEPDTPQTTPLQALTSRENLTRAAGMPPFRFDFESFKGQTSRTLGYADHRITAGPGQSDNPEVTDPIERLTMLRDVYLRGSWVMRDLGGNAACAIADNTAGDDTAEALDLLTAAYACADPGAYIEIPDALEKTEIAPKAFRKALAAVRAAGASDTDIEAALTDHDHPYLDTYYLDLIGRDPEQMCPEVFAALQARSTKLLGVIQAIQMQSDNADEIAAFRADIDARRNYDTLVLFNSLALLPGFARPGDEQRVMRREIVNPVPLPACR